MPLTKAPDYRKTPTLNGNNMGKVPWETNNPNDAGDKKIEVINRYSRKFCSRKGRYLGVLSSQVIAARPKKGEQRWKSSICQSDDVITLSLAEVEFCLHDD